LEPCVELKEFLDNPHYERQRQKQLAGLTDSMIDAPIVGIINTFNRLPYCFTLQSCYGHFFYKGQKEPHNLEPLPVDTAIDKVEYRIAYIALCIENSTLDRGLFQSLKQILALGSENIQFCSAEWFWKRQVNSYALQVEPERFKHQDKAILDYSEALYIENVRNEFYDQLKALFLKQID
jgi:hypothetical protein